MLTLTASSVTPMAEKCTFRRRLRVRSDGFPSFLPKEVENIKDPFARKLATRIVRLPVSLKGNSIMSSCVKPLIESKKSPVVLLHGFDSYDVKSELGLSQFWQLWKSYIKKPMILVGPSLGAAVAIDFAVNYPEAVEKLVLIDASVYAEGTGNLTSLPKFVAYAGASLLKSVPLRLYVNLLAFTEISFNTSLDWMNIGRLHCLLPWWEDATVDFMRSGGYKVGAQIEQVKQKTLLIWGEDDQIISNKLAVRLHCELPNAIIRQIPDCGHLPHVERPSSVAKLIVEFAQRDFFEGAQYISVLKI